jgi:hypothetical protein
LWYYYIVKKDIRRLAAVRGYSQMRKLIVKTALISLASAIGAVALVCLIGALAFPSWASDVCYDMGMYGASATLAESAYNASESEESLSVLVERGILAEDSAIVLEYGTRLIETDYFKQTTKNEGYSGNYKGYIVGNVAVCTYKNGNATSAVELALSGIGEGYLPYNSMQHLIYAALSSEDKDLALQIKTAIEGLSFPLEQQQLLLQDVAMLSDFAN